MNNKINKQLLVWEKVTQVLADDFVKLYFGSDTEAYWVGEDIGFGVLVAGDYFFDLKRIVEALKFKATEKQLFDYYDLEIESANKGSLPLEVTFENYLKLDNLKTVFKV